MLMLASSSRAGDPVKVQEERVNEEYTRTDPRQWRVTINAHTCMLASTTSLPPTYTCYLPFTTIAL